MISFLWPWAFMLLPGPFLLKRWLVPKFRFGSALRLPSYERIEAAVGHRGSASSALPFGWSETLTWLLLVTAVAQPLWIGDDQPVPVTGRDLMMLIDVSGSMRQMDFEMEGQALDRLAAVKLVAARFARDRRGDRVGLILFGQRPHLRAGLTHDRRAVAELISEAEIALAGESTAIGDAVGLALKRMREIESKSRVVVLLTDGANNEGNINPRQAARLAKSMGVKLYTIGVGAPNAPAPNPYGVWSSDNAARFEQEVLQDMADLTGGRFFHVLDADGLRQAYADLDKLEPALGGEAYKYFAQPLYVWPLALALLVQTLTMVLSRRRVLQRPRT